MRDTVKRLGSYSLLRLVFLLLAVTVAVYLTVIIANMGGELDKIRKAQIRFNVGLELAQDQVFRQMPRQEQTAAIEELAELEYKRLGMDRPFFPERSFRYLQIAMTLNLGRAEYVSSDTGSREVRRILLERLPTTLLLFATAELFLFFIGLFMALFLSRRYGSFLDRLTVGLAPTSAAPGWFYGIFLIMIFAASLRVLPWGGYAEPGLIPGTVEYSLSVLKRMVLPVTAIVMGSLFASVYSWRTFFLIYSSEDYVELARAKGLSSRAVERRYLLRPTLPPIITSFLLLLISMWMGQIVLETVFRWPGLGQLYFQAVNLNDTPVIVGVIVIYGYLLAATVFLLDFVYAIVDPRVRIEAARGGA